MMDPDQLLVKNKNTLFCSFCGKSQHEVKKLIAGPNVFICCECVDLCFEIILTDKTYYYCKTPKETAMPDNIHEVTAAEAEVWNNLTRDDKANDTMLENVLDNYRAKGVQIQERSQAFWNGLHARLGTAGKKLHLETVDGKTMVKVTEK